MELKERKRILETDQRHLDEFLINPTDPGRESMQQRIKILKEEIRQEENLQKPIRIHGNHLRGTAPNPNTDLKSEREERVSKAPKWTCSKCDNNNCKGHLHNHLLLKK